MTSSDVQVFINKWMGRYNNYDGAYGTQCKDLFSQYNHDLVKAPYIVGHPKIMWNGYEFNTTAKKYYSKIKNSWTFVPKLGDVIFFDVYPYGHIGIVSAQANLFWVTVFSQNDPMGSPCRYKAYNYIKPKCFGVWRPKSLV